MFKRRCQRGFATLEVILMIMVIGILASIAVPRFTSVTTSANTAKIQSDLATIDTAIAIYYMEKGTYPNDITNNLKDYLQDADKIKPPTGQAYINGTATKIEATSYGFKTVNNETRAALDDHTAGEFTSKSNGTSNNG